jgi:DNA polymerase III delta prime subunit
METKKYNKLGDKNLKFHPDILKNLKKYSEKKTGGILNTVFFGPPGSGKNYLIHKFLCDVSRINNCSLAESQPELKKHVDEAYNVYYSNDVYILIDGNDWKSSKVSISKFIEELTRTGNVATSRTKFIYIRYLDSLNEQQQQSLRQLVEDAYTNTRFIFSCRSKDKVDPALLSRCLKIRVPSPAVQKLFEWQKNSTTYTDKNELTKIIENANRNANTVINMILDYNISGNEITNANSELANYIFNIIKEKKSMTNVQDLSEKIFKCDISITPVMKEYLKIIPKSKVKDSVYAVENYLKTSTKVIFDMSEFLFKLSLILCAADAEN